jgi:hypothetical protein
VVDDVEGRRHVRHCLHVSFLCYKTW